MMKNNSKNWLEIEDEFRKKFDVVINKEWGRMVFPCEGGYCEESPEDILAFFKPYFQENLHEEAKEELEMDCQWENCSGGQYCENHSLERRPESSWKEEFDNLSDYRFVNDQNRKEMKYFISKVEKEAYERGRNSVDNVSK